jgi:hypothetical protein
VNISLSSSFAFVLLQPTLWQEVVFTSLRSLGNFTRTRLPIAIFLISCVCCVICLDKPIAIQYIVSSNSVFLIKLSFLHYQYVYLSNFNLFSIHLLAFLYAVHMKEAWTPVPGAQLWAHLSPVGLGCKHLWERRVTTREHISNFFHIYLVMENISHSCMARC